MSLAKNTVAVIILSLVVSLSVYLVLAQGGWVEPIVAPPGGNADAPLNTGSTGQSKSGGLILNTGGAANGLIVSSGNVGIGITEPRTPLEIKSTLDSTLRLTQAGGGWNYIEFYNDTARTLWMGMQTDSSFGINGQVSLDTTNGNVSLNNSRLMGLAAPIAASDAATKGYVDAQIPSFPTLVSSYCEADGTFQSTSCTTTAVCPSGKIIKSAGRGSAAITTSGYKEHAESSAFNRAFGSMNTGTCAGATSCSQTVNPPGNSTGYAYVVAWCE